MKQFNLTTKSVKSLFLLLALLLGGTSPTWADELTIFGSSTQTRSDLPIYGYNADTSGDQCEFVVPASLLSSMNGKNITGLKFYTATFSWGTNIPEYKVYLKEVASTTLSAFSGDTDATTVYTGTLSLADGVMTVTFAEPYEYNGGNLLIGTKVSKTGSYRPTNSSTFYGDTSSDVQCGRSSMGGSYFIPRTTFVYESANVSGPAMTVKDGTSKITTGYSYNFGLTTAGTTKTFALKNPGDANVALSVNATTGYTAELSSSTLVAGGEATLTITMNATGDGTVTITSTTEGIDDFVINVSGTVRNPNKMWCNFADGVPTGWTNSGNWSIATTGAPENTSGAGYAYNTSYGTNKLMYSPLVTIADGEKLYLMAKGHGSTASWNVLKIQYSSDGNTWTTAKDLTGITNSWQSVEVTEIPAGNWYIGFYGSYAYFTDIYGGEESTSPVLALSQSSYDFGLISANTTSSDITITNTGKSELTGMTITSDNENFTVSVTDNATTIAANGGTTKFNVTMAPNVTGAQSATITIASDNADDLTFTATGAVAKAGTSTVDFNDNQLPNGWSKAGNTSFTDGAAYFYYSTNTLTSPKLTFVAGDFLVVKAKMASGYGYVTVKGSTDGTTFTEIKKLDISLLNQTDYTTCIVSNIATTVKYIQLDGYYCYVDEIAGLTYAPVLSVTTGDPATAVTSPAAYAFGEVSADQTVTYNFTNSGAGTINITNVVSDNDVFTTNWTETVAASNYDLVITANYDATKAGEQNGAITVTTTEGEFVINLTSTFLAANAPKFALFIDETEQASGAAFAYGVITANATKEFIIKNNGTGALNVTSITLPDADFSTDLETAPTTEVPLVIAAGGSKTIKVNLAANAKATKSGNIVISAQGFDDFTFAASAYVLTGTETVAFTSVPDGWDKGSWNLDNTNNDLYTASSTKPYLTTPKLTCVANDFIVVNAKKYDNDSGDYIQVQYSTDNGDTWTNLQKLDDSTLPTRDAGYSDILVNNIPDGTNKLRFQGYYARIKQIAGLTYAPVLTVTKSGEAVTSPAAHAFGEVGTNQTVTYNFTNSGAGTINITNVESDNVVFTTNWTATVAASNYDLVITANYDEDKAGEQNGAITVTTTEGTFVINLTSTFLAANAPELAVSTNAIDFVKVTADAVETVTVTNNGTGSMTVNIASDSEDFVVSPTQLTEIGAGQSKTFNITFKYGTPYGVKNGNITVTPTYDENAKQTITVTGNAKDPEMWEEDFSGNALPDGWRVEGSGWTFADGVAKGTYTNGSYLYTPYLKVEAGKTMSFEAIARQSFTDLLVYYSKDGGAYEQYTDGSWEDLSTSEVKTYTISGLDAGIYKFRVNAENLNLDNFEGFKLATVTAISETTEPTLTAGVQDVELTYTKAAEKWGTLALPFATTTAELGTLYGTTVKAYALTDYDSGTNGLTFGTVTELIAGKPYVIYSEGAMSGAKLFTNKEITATTASNVTYSPVTFQSTYAPIAAGDMTGKWGVTPAGKIAKAGTGAYINGFRAYFDGFTSAPSLSFEDTTTGITIVKQADELDMDGKAYNLTGQRVNSATKGLYIINGRKVVIK